MCIRDSLGCFVALCCSAAVLCWPHVRKGGTRAGRGNYIGQNAWVLSLMATMASTHTEGANAKSTQDTHCTTSVCPL
eukprot:11633975-Alexandrium_andersonii.AAC.1